MCETDCRCFSLGGGRYGVMKALRSIAILFAICCLLVPPTKAGDAARAIDFARDVQPIFEKNCTACHGAKKQKGGYRLDRKSSALKSGEDAVILPGRSAESPLIRRVTGAKADEI